MRAKNPLKHLNFKMILKRDFPKSKSQWLGNLPLSSSHLQKSYPILNRNLQFSEEALTIFQENHTERKFPFEGIDLPHFILQTFDEIVKLRDPFRHIPDHRNLFEEIGDRFRHKSGSKIQTEFRRKRTHY